VRLALAPPPLLDGPVRLYYVGLVLSVLAYLGFLAIRRAPFGVAGRISPMA
jgi:branched-chain amino acid transport system permease protein